MSSPDEINELLKTGLRNRLSQLNEDDLLAQAQKFIADITLQLSKSECAPTHDVIQNILNALSNNLDTETVFAILQHWIKDCQNGDIGGKPGELSRALDALLGLAI